MATQRHTRFSKAPLSELLVAFERSCQPSPMMARNVCMQSARGKGVVSNASWVPRHDDLTKR